MLKEVRIRKETGGHIRVKDMTKISPSVPEILQGRWNWYKTRTFWQCGYVVTSPSASAGVWERAPREVFSL